MVQAIDSARAYCTAGNDDSRKVANLARAVGIFLQGCSRTNRLVSASNVVTPSGAVIS